ncbi:MAG: hypothetical protein ACE5IK_11160 [Acidobacteriota bacterium]
MGLAVAVLAVAVLLPRAARPVEARPAEEKTRPPVDLGLIEEAEVHLIILDVEVTDRDGRPIRGLDAADFELELSGKRWPIESVDDFCRCGRPPARAAARQAGDSRPTTDPASAPAAGETGPPAAPPVSQQVRYALYFDFSQLQPPGRSEARGAALDWLAHNLTPEDEVMVAAFATGPGLREVLSFTSDAAAARSSVIALFDDPAFSDPFPSLMKQRRDECGRCLVIAARSGLQLAEWGCCGAQAMNEYWQEKRALTSLRNFLDGLERIPGRKAVLFFNQNGLSNPLVLYPMLIPDEARLSDQRVLLEEVSAAAVAARASLHVATVPQLDLDSPITDATMSLGSVLAEATGGSANRSRADLASTLAGAGRGCCIYRLTLNPRGMTGRRIYRARVRVKGRPLPQNFRVQFLGPADRWFRQARSVLSRPARVRDFPVTAALVPAGLAGARCEAEVAVAVDTGVLSPAPGSGRTARWRVGALLIRDEGEQNWEMMTEAALRLPDPASAPRTIVHEHRLQDLEPGRYRLVAFVEDRVADRIGAAEARLGIDRSGPIWLVGPMAMTPWAVRVRMSLPMIDDPGTASRGGVKPERAAVPLDTTRVAAGDTVEFRTMLCGKQDPPFGITVHRRVDTGDRQVIAYDTAGTATRTCLLYTDRLAFDADAAGDYTFRVETGPLPRGRPLHGEMTVHVVTP